MRVEQILEFLRSAENTSFLCYHASDLREAMRILVHEKVELVVSKGVFADAEHGHVLARYRKNDRDPVVLCLLEDEEKSVILDTSDDAADDYIFYKDLSSERLHEAVGHAFERRELLSELKTVQVAAADGKAVYRGLLHCLDVALFLVCRRSGELVFNNKVAEAWFSGSLESTVRDLFEYAVLEADSVELEIRTECLAAPIAELRSVAVEWRGEACSLITLRNISKRKRAEDAYRSSQRRLDLAIKASNIGLWSWDLRNNQLHFSDRWKRQLGFSSCEFPNTMDAFRKNLHSDDQSAVAEVFGQALRGEICEIELKYRMRCKDGGYRWIICRAEIFPDDSGRLSSLLGSHIDITDQSQHAAKAGLESSLGEKLSFRMERIAAELERNASRLRANFRGDSSIVDRIQEIERLSVSFACLNEVLQLEADKGNNAIEVIELGSEVRELYGAQRSLVPAKVELEIEDSEEIRIYGLSLRALRFALTEALVCVAERVNLDFKSRLRLTVGRSKNTPGVPCLRYRYTGEPVGTADLLALSKTPHVRVSSEKEGGYAFLTVEFETEVPAAPIARSNKRPLALLAEDEGVLRLAVRTMLESLGFDVVVTEDGAAAVDAFSRQKWDFDLVLVDLQMPEIDGFGVVAAIRASREDLPVIRMSGDSNDERIGYLEETDECSCFLAKPFGIAGLKLAIENFQKNGV